MEVIELTIGNTKKIAFYKDVVVSAYGLAGTKEIHIKLCKKNQIPDVMARLEEMAKVMKRSFKRVGSLEEEYVAVIEDTTVKIIQTPRQKPSVNAFMEDLFTDKKEKYLIIKREGMELMPDIWQRAFNNILKQLPEDYRKPMREK